MLQNANDFSIEDVPLDQRTRELDALLSTLVASSQHDLPHRSGARRSEGAQVVEAMYSTLDLLKGETMEFAPTVQTYLLSAQDFRKKGASLSREMQQDLERFTFYNLTFPLTLFTASGWAFSRLECAIQFGSPDENAPPVIHALLPDQEWAEVLNLKQSIHLELDAAAKYSLSPEVFYPDGGKATAALPAKLSGRAALAGQLSAGPFKYRLRRQVVQTRGIGNNKAFWRLDSRDALEQEDLSLGVVLKVPKERTAAVSVWSEVRARHEFQFLTADLFRDDWPSLWGLLRDFFAKGAPLVHTRHWPALLS